MLLWERRPRTVWLATAALVVLWGGLLLTLSQSSFAALLCGLFVLAALRFPLRKVLPVVVAALAIGLVVVIAFQYELRVDLGSTQSLDDASSGRYELMRGGVDLALDRPVWGFGSGSFAEEYLAHGFGARSDAVSASHTIPLTVAAEQGLIGLAVYLALLAAALARLLKGARGDPARAFIAAGFVAVVVHTWMYAAFLEDPVTWTLLAVGAVLARAAAAPARARVRGRARSRAGRSRSRAAPSAPTPGLGRPRRRGRRRSRRPAAGRRAPRRRRRGGAGRAPRRAAAAAASKTASARGWPGSFNRLTWRLATTRATATESGIRGGSSASAPGAPSSCSTGARSGIALERLRQQQEQQRRSRVAGVALHARDVRGAGRG